MALPGVTGNYLGRRFESAEAASCFVVLLVLPSRSAFEAFEAIFADVLTVFRAIQSPLFLPVSIGDDK